jgi:SHS2 domain-containing protein
MSYSFLEHTADVKFRADGSDLDKMFVSAAEALNEVVRGDIEILEQEAREFGIEGKDRVSLLYNFLEEFLVLLDSEDFLTARIKEIEVEEGGLRCVVVGDKAENYKFTNDVKAVTFSEMFVREEGGKFICEVVLDV